MCMGATCPDCCKPKPPLPPRCHPPLKLVDAVKNQELSPPPPLTHKHMLTVPFPPTHSQEVMARLRTPHPQRHVGRPRGAVVRLRAQGRVRGQGLPARRPRRRPRRVVAERAGGRRRAEEGWMKVSARGQVLLCMTVLCGVGGKLEGGGGFLPFRNGQSTRRSIWRSQSLLVGPAAYHHT